MKKLLIGLTGLAVVAGLVFGFDVLSYHAKKGVKGIQQAARDSISIPDKIGMLEEKLAELGPKIEEARRVVALQDVRVGKLNEEIASRQNTVAKQWESVVALRTAMDEASSKEFVSVEGKRIKADQIKDTLKSKWETHKASEEVLKQRQELSTLRSQVLASNREAYDNLVAAEEKLKLTIEELKARHEKIKAQQIESMQAVDDSPTADVLKLYEEIDEQLRVEEKLIEMDGDRVPADFKADEREATSLLDEIDAARAKKATDGKATDLINVE